MKWTHYCADCCVQVGEGITYIRWHLQVPKRLGPCPIRRGPFLVKLMRYFGSDRGEVTGRTMALGCSARPVLCELSDGMRPWTFDNERARGFGSFPPSPRIRKLPRDSRQAGPPPSPPNPINAVQLRFRTPGRVRVIRREQTGGLPFPPFVCNAPPARGIALLAHDGTR